MAAILRLLPLLLYCSLLAGNVAATYVCPLDKCKPPSCMCASTQPPLSPAPQFVVVTNDDAATVMTTPAMLRMLEKAGTNRNGCPLPATWYISVEYTQPEYVQMVYMKGHEIATHTYSHTGLANATEIVGARKWLNETAGVPLGKIRGFRGPYLLHDEKQRSVLAANGFLYDSTITSAWGSNSFSPDGQRNVWPFTMDYGVPIDCTVGTGPCSVAERNPGLWEFPIWNMQNDDGIVVASMDPAVDNITDLYVRQLQRSYNGNRAPVGVFLHAARLLGFQEVADQYSAFLRYAVSLENVWIVTVSEVLSWMMNPVPAAAYSLSCPTPTDMTFPGGRFCLSPAGGCLQGTWDPKLCTCACLNQGDAKLSGYCPDPATGICNVVKEYSLATSAWACPAGTPVGLDHEQTPAAGTAPSTGSGTVDGTGTGGPQQQANPGAADSPPTLGGDILTASAPHAATSPVSGMADVQPLSGVQFAFYVRGEAADFAAKTEAVCTVLAALAAEYPAACTIASVVETAAPAGAATRRLASTGFLLVIAVINPTAQPQEYISSALTNAQQDGRLAAALEAAGVRLVPAEVPSTLSAAPGSSKGTIGIAVGCAVGGAALVCLALGTFWVVRSRRAKAAGSGSVRLPVSTRSQDEMESATKSKALPPTKGLRLTATAGPTRPGEASVSAYSSNSRGATPRHQTHAGPFNSAESGV